jgi:hypothetical protein
MAIGAENESADPGGFPAPTSRPDSSADLALSDRLHAADGRAVVLPPPTLSPTPNVAALLTMLHRRWLLALSLGLLGSATVGIATWLLMTKIGTYTVQAMVHLASTPDSLLPRAAPDFEKFAFFQMTQRTLVKSQVVLEDVLVTGSSQQHPAKSWAEGVVFARLRLANSSTPRPRHKKDSPRS